MYNIYIYVVPYPDHSDCEFFGVQSVNISISFSWLYGGGRYCLVAQVSQMGSKRKSVANQWPPLSGNMLLLWSVYMRGQSVVPGYGLCILYDIM